VSLDLFVWPMTTLAAGTRPVISDGFKAVAIAGRRQHLGVDVMYPRNPSGDARPPDFTRNFFCPTGRSLVVSCGPGRVFTVDTQDRHGIVVTVDHGVVDGVPRASVYRHLASVAVKSGDPVVAGSFLGFAGKDTAAGSSTPNHLHFELWDTSRPRATGQGPRDAFSIDPEPFMRRWRVKTSTGFTSPDVSPAGEDDAGEESSPVDLSTFMLVDLSVIHGGLV
jgi:hypothetical protein